MTYDDTPAVSDGGPWPAGAKPARKPPRACYNTALDYQAIQYQRVMPMASQNMPYPYLTDAGLADDFWVIRLMED